MARTGLCSRRTLRRSTLHLHVAAVGAADGAPAVGNLDVDRSTLGHCDRPDSMNPSLVADGYSHHRIGLLAGDPT